MKLKKPKRIIPKVDTTLAYNNLKISDRYHLVINPDDLDVNDQQAQTIAGTSQTNINEPDSKHKASILPQLKTISALV